jgi:hypothetical protein
MEIFMPLYIITMLRRQVLMSSRRFISTQQTLLSAPGRIITRVKDTVITKLSPKHQEETYMNEMKNDNVAPPKKEFDFKKYFAFTPNPRPVVPPQPKYNTFKWHDFVPLVLAIGVSAAYVADQMYYNDITKAPHQKRVTRLGMTFGQ